MSVARGLEPRAQCSLLGSFCSAVTRKRLTCRCRPSGPCVVGSGAEGEQSRQAHQDGLADPVG
eukprot:15141901-Alexandrium_andersonii.AAC.1